MKIRIEKRQDPQPKPDESSLVFGAAFTDHMFIMDYTEGEGWRDPRIVPYGPLDISPASMVLHYAQEVFEGLKAYRNLDGGVQLFRPMENVRRLNRSAERLCMPQVDEDLALAAIEELVKIDADWVPSAPGTSLYIRPFMFAADDCLGARAGREYKFMIILSPVGAYYSGGLKPTRMYIEDVYARTVKGGTGEAKAGLNYANGYAAQEKAHAQGFEQILWLDGLERRFIEEVGTSNAFFRIDGKFVTPSLSGTILPGITRDSVIALLKAWGETVEERQITIDELEEAYQNGQVEEVFATGTAAVISPIGSLYYKGEDLIFNDGEIGPWAQKLYDALVGIQTGTAEDPFDWIVKLD